jgi:transposase
VAEVFFAP